MRFEVGFSSLLMRKRNFNTPNKSGKYKDQIEIGIAGLLPICIPVIFW